MNTRIYMINFIMQSANLFDFEKFIKTSPIIMGYWNYIPLVYCIKTLSSATELSNLFGQFFPGGNYIIIEVNPGNMNGILPKPAWDWFYAPPETRSPPHNLGLGALNYLGVMGTKP